MCWWWAYCAATRKFNASAKRGVEDVNPDFVKPK